MKTIYMGKVPLPSLRLTEPFTDLLLGSPEALGIPVAWFLDHFTTRTRLRTDLAEPAAASRSYLVLIFQEPL